MQDLTSLLPIDKTNPSLWFEHLVIFREPDSNQYIRSIPFAPGLNIIWAKEPARGSTTGIHAAGHGVGKTSLCLLLRFCLGDSSKAVTDLREELLGEFASGGVAAILHMHGQVFSLCRYFNSYKDGLVLNGNDIERLWTNDEGLSYKIFEQQLAEEMLSKLVPRNIPVTGQAIEWRHVLAWLTRDQGSRFKSFFAWREGEGTGLQRSKQDPPLVIRTVLGLLEKNESGLLVNIAKLERDLAVARQETIRLQHEPALIRQRIESEMRAWRGLANDLPLRTDDLFKNSVEREIKTYETQIKEKIASLDIEYDQCNQEQINQRAALSLLETQYERALAEYELADAATRKDEVTYRAIADKLSRLRQLTGWCEHGNTNFQSCQHVQSEINRLQVTDFRDGRDKMALEKAMAQSALFTASAMKRKDQLNEQLKIQRSIDFQKKQTCQKIRIKRDSAAVEADRSTRLLSELSRWEVSEGSDAAKNAIDGAITKSHQIEQEISSDRTRLAVLENARSAREKHLGALMEILTTELLSGEAFGVFDPRDESRPFRLSMRGGEAYRVLEVLLGDLTCMLDGANHESAFPGFVIHDCPREADMSPGLYENFLLLVARLQEEHFNKSIPFQYIVTTTTPPPSTLCSGTYVRLELDPSQDSELLFCKRFSI